MIKNKSEINIIKNKKKKLRISLKDIIKNKTRRYN